MSDAPAAAQAAPATDAPTGAPVVAPPPPAEAAKPAEKTPAKPTAAPQKAADAKPWVNPYAARKTAPTAPPKPATAAPPPTAPKVDPVARLAELEASHKSTSEMLTRHQETLKARVAQDLAALPERVRKVIERDAAGDPLATLRMITSAHEMGITATAIPTGATTAPPPPSTASAVDPDAALLAEYESLKGKAPIRANAFRMMNSAAIARAESRRAS